MIFDRDGHFYGPLLGRAVAAIIVLITLCSIGSMARAEPSPDLQRYLDLPLTNRDASRGPGGVHSALPTDPAELRTLLDQARGQAVAPSRYAALLYQYWLVDTTTAAGIDLATWNPRLGVEANRQNLIKSYTFYEQLQLKHRELQWAGMAGQVGADFGGGLIDFELATNVYDWTRLQALANAIVGQANQAGAGLVEQLPAGLRALARVGSTVTPDDLHLVLGNILVMQKNIFSDLMPMHRAYVAGGLAPLEEMRAAGLFGDDVLDAWRDIASNEPDRIAEGNAVLLQREQGQVIKEQWDRTRAYKGDVGEAITYVSTVGGSPSVAGVVAPRSFRPIEISNRLADGRTATLTTPLPSWNWAEYEPRWDYITTELLPKYKDLVTHDWPALERILRTPYETQLETHRPLMSIPSLLQAAAAGTKVSMS